VAAHAHRVVAVDGHAERPEQARAEHLTIVGAHRRQLLLRRLGERVRGVERALPVMLAAAATDERRADERRRRDTTAQKVTAARPLRRGGGSGRNEHTAAIRRSVQIQQPASQGVFLLWRNPAARVPAYSVGDERRYRYAVIAPRTRSREK